MRRGESMKKKRLLKLLKNQQAMTQTALDIVIRAYTDHDNVPEASDDDPRDNPGGLTLPCRAHELMKGKSAGSETPPHYMRFYQ